jgi:hypothetical protein
MTNASLPIDTDTGDLSSIYLSPCAGCTRRLYKGTTPIFGTEAEIIVYEYTNTLGQIGGIIMASKTDTAAAWSFDNYWMFPKDFALQFVGNENNGAAYPYPSWANFVLSESFITAVSPTPNSHMSTVNTGPMMIRFCDYLDDYMGTKNVGLFEVITADGQPGIWMRHEKGTTLCQVSVPSANEYSVRTDIAEWTIAGVTELEESEPIPDTTPNGWVVRPPYTKQEEQLADLIKTLNKNKMLPKEFINKWKTTLVRKPEGNILPTIAGEALSGLGQGIGAYSKQQWDQKMQANEFNQQNKLTVMKGQQERQNVAAIGRQKRFTNELAAQVQATQSIPGSTPSVGQSQAQTQAVANAASPSVATVQSSWAAQKH